MKWIFVFVFFSALNAEELLLYPLGQGDFFGAHFQNSETSQMIGLGLGKKFESKSLGFGLGGVYQKNFYKPSTSKSSWETYLLYCSLDYKFLNLFAGYGNRANKFGLNLQVHPEKQVLIYRNFFNTSNSYSDNFGIISGKEVQLKVLFSRHFSNYTTFYEFYFGVSFNISHFSLNTLGNSKSNSESFSSLGSLLVFKEISRSYLSLEAKVYEENFPKHKKPVKPKKLFFPRLFNKKTYIYPLSLDELLNKKIPLKQAVLIHEASKNPVKYTQLIKTLPRDIQTKCSLLQKQKRIENEN